MYGKRQMPGIDPTMHAKLRSLPQVQRLLEMPETRAMAGTTSVATVTAALRGVLERIRADLQSGQLSEVPTPGDIVARAEASIVAHRRPGMRHVINATGIVLHTNLGRAPLAAEAIDAVTEVARGYSNLEFDLEKGERGSRAEGVESLLRRTTGAEAALAVNNAAAAVLLCLSALASGGEVVVSRGELIEIGGGFRIPDVIRQGGARLVEVGTTNKTHLADYRDAVRPETRVLLKVHRSNFRIVGFTAETEIGELGPLASEHGLVLMLDLGSGAMIDLGRFGLSSEPTVRDALESGADLVVCSGDKLLGGPQAGIIVGRSGLVEPLRKHPLYRALRLDKMSLAALEATLRLYDDPVRAAQHVPVLRRLAQDEACVRDRADRVRRLLGDVADVWTESSDAYVGGGTLPGEALRSHAVGLRASIPASDIGRRLRLHSPAVIGRIASGHLLLDMFTVADDEIPDLIHAVGTALAL